MTRGKVFIGIFLILILLAGCMPGPNGLADSPNGEGEVAGFLMGLWQGVISPFAFVVSLFSKTVEIYEVHNTVGWYNFGFLLGASIIFGGSGGGAAGRRRRRRDY